MKKVKQITCTLLLGGLLLTASSFLFKPLPMKTVRFPYKQAGLTERQAAEHLLSRFTYGATPGQIDTVLKMGLENWFSHQLAADLPDDSLDRRLSAYDAINLSNTEVCKIFPPGFVIRSMAIKDSVISKDSVDNAVDKKAFNAQLQAYMNTKGFRSDQDLYKQFISQHILRAAYSQNQLREVLTDFWFNHFNVSFFKGECAQFIPAYERDVIRPNALGKFDAMLLASAQSPAMLYYLDNFTSVGPPAAVPVKQPAKPVAEKDTSMSMMMMSAGNAAPNKAKTITQPGKNVNGLNENYAREVMELHTLGVDGGYTQQDVTQAARILTGWTVYPISDMAYGSAMKGLVAKIGEGNLSQKGYVHQGDFLFTPGRHDQGEKVVLGHHFAATTDPAAGYREGVDLLELLAHHPSAARFICRKLAIRFVSDNPPQRLIDKMARSFTEQDGDIKAVLMTMVASREFWDKKMVTAKIKSPFELAVSSIRALKADVKDPYPLFSWISRMGEKIYYYQAPTGFPDRASYWINTGALINRMDFGIALAAGQIGGVAVNWKNLGFHHTTDSVQEILRDYTRLLMPGQDPELVVQQLAPVWKDTVMMAKMGNAGLPLNLNTATAPTPEKPMAGAPGDMMLMSAVPDSKPKPVSDPPRQSSPVNNSRNNMQSIAAAIIIGSPQFQRR